MMKEITESALAQLRENVMRTLSPKRFRHTVAVEEMVVRLCALYCPDMTDRLRAAAILHDVTKEWTTERHCEWLIAHGIPVTGQDRVSPKTLHARSAEQLIRENFPEWSDPVILSAVRWHTTGRAGMTLTE